MARNPCTPSGAHHPDLHIPLPALVQHLVKRLHHSVICDLTPAFEAMDLAADAGLRISAYAAEVGAPPPMTR